MRARIHSFDGSARRAMSRASATPRRVAAIAPRRASTRNRGNAPRAARWESLDVIHLLVFDLDDPTREALYTHSRRTATRARNAFVCFERASDARRAAMAVSERARAVPAVDAAPPAALKLLAQMAGYDVEFVEEGGRFDAPTTIVDEGATIGREDFAVSAAALAAYLTGDEDEGEGEGETRATRDARARAAATMRDALRAPAKRVRDAAASSASMPVAGGRAFMFGAAAAMRAVARAARDRAARDARE